MNESDGFAVFRVSFSLIQFMMVASCQMRESDLFSSLICYCLVWTRFFLQVGLWRLDFHLVGSFYFCVFRLFLLFGYYLFLLVGLGWSAVAHPICSHVLVLRLSPRLNETILLDKKKTRRLQK